MKTCKNCGTTHDGKFCPNCGTPAEEEPIVQEPSIAPIDPKSQLIKSIEKDGLSPTWYELHPKSKFCFIVSDWLSNLLYIPSIIFLATFFVKLFTLNGKDFSQFNLFELVQKRNSLINDLSLWASLTVAFYILQSAFETIPDLIFGHYIIKWVEENEIDLSIYLKRQRSGSQELPCDMGFVTNCFYFQVNKNKYKIKNVVSILYIFIAVILAIYLFSNIDIISTFLVDNEIFKQLKIEEYDPSISSSISVFIAAGLFIILWATEKVLNKLTYKAQKKWAKNYR